MTTITTLSPITDLIHNDGTYVADINSIVNRKTLLENWLFSGAESFDQLATDHERT